MTDDTKDFLKKIVCLFLGHRYCPCCEGKRPLFIHCNRCGYTVGIEHSRRSTP
jgi:hypothetical protein